MRKRAEGSPIGIDLSVLPAKEHLVGRGMIVHVENQITVGFGVTVDKRVLNREVIKDSMVIIVSPVEVDIVTFGPKGVEYQTPYDTSKGFKATRLYAKREGKVAQAASNFVDFRKDPEASGRLLKLNIRTGSGRVNSEVVASHADVESINAHIPFLLSPEYIVFEAL